MNKERMALLLDNLIEIHSQSSGEDACYGYETEYRSVVCTGINCVDCILFHTNQDAILEIKNAISRNTNNQDE